MVGGDVVEGEFAAAAGEHGVILIERNEGAGDGLAADGVHNGAADGVAWGGGRVLRVVLSDGLMGGQERDEEGRACWAAHVPAA